MSAERPCVVVSRRLPGAIEERMADLFDTRLNPGDTPMDGPALLAALHTADVLVSAITDRIDAGLIAALPQSVKLIAQFGAGVDNINVEAAHARGITVTNTPSVMAEDTADMAMALMLSLPRRLVEGANVLPGPGDWAGFAPTAMLGARLSGKALGIVGMGRIGTAVARRAKAFGLSIHYWSRSRRPEQLEDALEATHWPEIEDLLSAADIVSLHLPANRETVNLLSAERLAALRPGAWLVNVSRPELIEEDALATAIEKGHIAGAALDVFSHANGVNPRLLALAQRNRVILTPHMASATLESRLEMGETVIVNIRTFLDGHPPPHRVLPEGAPV